MRLPILVLALLVLAGLLWWLLRPTLARYDLGPGTRLVARVGAERFLLGDDAGGWWLFPAQARRPGEGLALPPSLEGQGSLDSRGRALFRRGTALVRLSAQAGDLAEEEIAVEESLPESARDWWLLGTDGADEPVLAAGGGEQPALLLVRSDDGAWGALQAPAAATGPARLPPGAPCILSPTRRALAFRGLEGWEAWTWDGSSPVRRVARGCHGEAAVFTPGGEALVLEGRTTGIDERPTMLWRLELNDDRQGYLADGNLGSCARVPWTHGFRGEPTLLLAPQWDNHGNLQLQQTHLSGGGRWRFSTGHYQHYLPALSADGTLLAYAQAGFDPAAGEPFEEELYLFDFARAGRPAIRLATREGGRAGQGPVFAGRAALLWIADGRVHGAQPRLSASSPGGNP